MKVTVELNQSQILEAIRLYLETNGTPIATDVGDKPFEIKLYMHGELVQTPDMLHATMRFEAVSFSQGPYR